MHRRSCLLLITLAACGGDDAATPDAAPQPATVLAAMAAQGAWSEDFTWGPTAYVACAGCEHLLAYEVEDDRFIAHIYERMPGEPATTTERCQAVEYVTESAVDGFDPRDRVVVRIEIPGDENTCGWGDFDDDYVHHVVSRDADGAPTYIAMWPADGDPAAAFPGYDYAATGTLASPIKPCVTAPDEPCEPACDLAAGGCDLPEP